MRARVFLTLASVGAVALLGVPPALATTVTIPVEADTYVSGTSPNANFGDSAFFDTYGGKNLHCLPAVDYTAPAYGLLRFDLDAIPAGRQLIDARVYTTTRAGYAQDGDPYHHLIYLPDDAWGESTVTFNTRPPDGTVAPGDPTLSAFPGTDIRASAFSVGSSPVFRDFCTTDPGLDESHVFPDLADTVFKPATLSESDFLSHLSADRANTDDTKVSLEVYTPNCAVCTVGTDLAYWSRYVTKEDGSRPPGAKPHLVVTYADISAQASAPSPAATGANVTYSATFTNDTTGALPLSSVIVRLPAGFSYVPGSSSANLNGDPTVEAGVATWNRDAADLAPGEKLDVFFALEAADTPGSYDVAVSGSVGFESPFNVGQATVSVDVVAAVPTGVTAGLDSGDGTSIEAGADVLDIFQLPLDAIIHPASTPITQQPITQQPITQQPITQQPITQQPIAQMPIAQMPIAQFGFGDAASLALLGDVTLDTLPTTIAGGWKAVLAGTPLQNAPFQGVTLRQVLALAPLPSQITLKMADLDFSQSKLRNLSLLALAFGSTPLASLDPGGGGGALADWCATFAGPPLNCTNPNTLDGQTVLSAGLQGAPITQQPITQQPIAQMPIAQMPIAQMPIAQMPLQAPITQQPITQQPITQQPITQQELTYFALSASPITQHPITQQGLANGLGTLNLRDILSSGRPDTCPGARYGAVSALGEIPVAGLPATLVAAGATGDLAAAFCAGQVVPSATLAQLAQSVDLSTYTLGEIGWYGGLTVTDLIRILGPDAANYTVGDLIAIMVNRQVLDWENLDPAVLSAFGTNADGRLVWDADASIQADGDGNADLTVKVELPPGFRYDTGELFDGSGYAAVAICGIECELTLDDLDLPGDGPTITTRPSPDGPIQTLEFTLADAGFGTAYTVRFATYAGFVLGPALATETTSVAGFQTSSSDSVVVRDTFEDSEDGNDLPSSATTIDDPNTSVEESYISGESDVDYYEVDVPAGARVAVHMTNLSADLDLALFAPDVTELKPGATPGPALQDPPIRDMGVDKSNVNTSLEPAGLQDSPITQQPITQHSINRNLTEEDVAGISPAGGGTFLIRVSGYDGAHTDRPYSLRVRVTDPIREPTCTARTLPAATPGTAPPATLPAGTNTLFLLNRQRLAATYGASAADLVSTALANIRANGLGVSGVVVPVETYPEVAAAYTAWDLNPCSSARANAVAAAISAKIDAFKAATSSVKNVVLIGGFDQIPAFAVPDLTRIANETGYASTFANNQYYGHLAAGNVLTDEPYYDTDPVPVDDGQFFVADLVGGRLVETPAQIAAQLDQYVASSGQLARSTAFAAGYDFTKDGAGAVASDLTASLGAPNVRQLISDTWTGTTLLGNQGLFPTTGASSFNLLNGHFDHTRMLTANGNAQGTLETVDATQLGALSGRVLFTVGCHSGLAVSDVIVGNTPDWAETLAGKRAHWAGQTGYGYGDTDTVAYSEQLMSYLARRLDGTVSIGEALTRAKQDYYLTAGGTLSAYDRKALLEATMFGLPFYGVGVAPTAIPATAPDPPVKGATNVTTPAGAPLGTDPVSGQPSAEFSVVPTFTLVSGPKGSHYSNAGQVTTVNYRPLVPRVSLPATRTGQTAHYPFVESLESAPDETGFNAAFSTPTVDLGSLSPEAVFADASFPSKLTSLVTTRIGSELRSQLNISTGQFIANPASANRSIGTMRRFTKITGRVFYTAGPDLTPTAIQNVSATRFGSNVGFVVNVPDAVRVLVLFRDQSAPVNGSIRWKSVELTNGGSGARWTGGSPIVGTSIEWLVQALDAHGNVATSSNKARYFDAAPAQSGSGITIGLGGSPESPTGYFAGTVTVTATGQAGVALTRRVDGGTERSYTGSFPVSGDGLHVVEINGSDGSSATRAFVIDTAPPLPPIIVTPPTPEATYMVGDVIAADYRCRDTSGIKSCVGTVGGNAVPSGSPLPTNSIGQKTLSVTATDVMDRTAGPVTRTYRVIWSFGAGFLTPVDNPPAVNLVAAGQSVPVRFSLGGDFGLGILAQGSPSSAKVACDTTAPVDDIEQTTTANSGLSFTGGQYTYTWKTDKAWRGTCRVFTMTLADGTAHTANFKFK